MQSSEILCYHDNDIRKKRGDGVDEKPINNEIIKLKRRFKRLQIWAICSIAALLSALGFVVYRHYDYMLFRILIADNYIHTDALDRLFLEHLGEVPDSYSSRFDNLVISIVTRELRRVAYDPYTFQYTPRQFVAHQEGVRARAAGADFYQVAPGVGYLFLPNISPYVRDFVMDNRYALNDFDSLIIDLRGNGGGELAALYDIAELFLPAGRTIGYETARHRIFSAHIRSRGNQHFYFDNIIFLQNYRTASAAEGLIMALQENLDNITTIGTRSYGKGIGQATLPLRGGFAVQATVIIIETPSGQTVHARGITPDIYYYGYGIIAQALYVINRNQ